MNTTPVHALTDIDGGIVVDPAPRLAGPPFFGGPGNTWTTNRISFLDWAPHYEGQPVTCGNGQPDSGETHENCETDVAEPPDSGTCGDSKCNDLNETSASCPADCFASTCSNGVCEAGEDATNCPDDCLVCGDGVCQASNGECTANCPGDCPPPPPAVCGNYICEAGETNGTCRKDCPLI